MKPLSEKSKGLRQSGIRAASVRCAEVGGINLGQGVCDLPIDDAIKQAAFAAIEQDKSMYSACEGAFALRQRLAKKLKDFNYCDVDPAKELLITHGSTGAFVCAVNTLCNTGDEVILFEPFYGYHKNILGLHHVGVRTVAIDLNDFSIDLNALDNAISAKTKAIVICTPNNPTGKVYSREELEAIGDIAKRHDLWLITDEIYEYITYPGYEHVSIASLKDFKERTLTISGFSKTYNMTGWRLGYVSGPEVVIEKMALIQDLLYVCPATPLQHAVIAALDMDENYYNTMTEGYLQKRDQVVATLRDIGFQVTEPQGAYYLLADFRKLGWHSAQDAVDDLLEKTKVATVAGSAFYQRTSQGQHLIRFCYALQQKKVSQALALLKVLQTPATLCESLAS